METTSPPVFGIAGYSGSGKTTLLEKLLPRFVGLGLAVSVIKETHHDFDIDHPGKDSWRHRQAGATEVLVTSARRWALMHELKGAPALTLAQCVERLSPCDLVLVEGWRREAIPKLEVHRAHLGAPLLHPDDPHVCAVASEERPTTALPWFHLDDVDGIAHFILSNTGLDHRHG